MTTDTPRRNSVHRTGSVLLVMISLLALVASGTVAVSAAGNPGQPTSDTGAGVDPPGGGDLPSPPPDGRSKIALGMSMPNNRDLGTLDAFTASIGGIKPATWSIWSQWGMSATRDFPTSVMNGLRDRGVTPFVFWEPWDRNDRNDPQFRLWRIQRGDQDAYIRQWARDAKAFGGRVLLRFAHEANGGYFPWTVNSTLNNTVADYVAAWRHVWDIFDEEGATNVKFVWSLAKQSCSGGCNPYAQFYPGNKYVDYMGFSSFNWGDFPGKSWKSMYQGYQKITGLLGQISGKPIIVAETASNSEGGAKGAWISDGYQEVYDKLPQIVAIIYLNFDLSSVDHPNWRLDNPKWALNAYAEIAAKSKFQGTVSQRARILARVDSENDKKSQRSTNKKKTTTKAKPAVQKGSEASDTVQTTSSPKARKAKTTKRSKKKSEPPATLDVFER